MDLSDTLYAARAFNTAHSGDLVVSWRYYVDSADIHGQKNICYTILNRTNVRWLGWAGLSWSVELELGMMRLMYLCMLVLSARDGRHTWNYTISMYALVPSSQFFFSRAKLLLPGASHYTVSVKG